MTEEVHLPPQAGSPPWRRSFALDLATRDGGDASGAFRRKMRTTRPAARGRGLLRKTKEALEGRP